MPPNNRRTEQIDEVCGALLRFDNNTVTDADGMCYADRMAKEESAGPFLRKKRTGSMSFGSSPAESDDTASETLLTETSIGSDSGSDSSAHSSAAISTKSKDDTALDLDKFPIVQVTFPLFLFLAIGTKYLAKNMPYGLAPDAATRTYVPAGWTYTAEETHFDNSAWTYGTDYFLSALMTYLAVRCLTATGTGGKNSSSNSRDSYQLRIRSATLLMLYAISTLAGGYAHQHYTTIESLNTPSFRFLWTICVGTVTSAGAAMLWIGSELCARYHANASSSEVRFRIPTVPTWFCVCWGIYITGICVVGGMSFTRPACDIFVAGTTQVVPTAYLVLLLAAHRWTDGKASPKHKGEDDDDTHRCCGEGSNQHQEHPCDRIKAGYRLVYDVGFLFNCPLLPMYPLLVQYTDWSLGGVNTLLHTWLTISWGMQAVGLRHFCLALNDDGEGATTTSTTEEKKEAKS